MGSERPATRPGPHSHEGDIVSNLRSFHQMARLAAQAIVVATVTALINLAFWWATHH